MTKHIPTHKCVRAYWTGGKKYTNYLRTYSPWEFSVEDVVRSICAFDRSSFKE